MALWGNILKGGSQKALSVRNTGMQVQEKAIGVNQYELDSILHQALFQFYGKNMPVNVGSDLVKHVREGYCTNSDLYAIVSYIIRSASRYRWKVKYRTKSGKLEDADESEINGLIQDYLTPEQIEAILGYKLVVGNSYIYGLSPDSGPNKGKIQELDVLPAHYTEILFGSISDPVGGYKLMLGDQTKIFDNPDMICHLKYWNPDVMQSGMMYGMSPLRAGAILLSQSTESFKSNAMSMSNQGPPYLLSKEVNGDLNEDQAVKLSERLYRRAWGVLNRYKPTITSGSVKAIQLGLSPTDLNILESQKMTFEQLCRIYRFPVTVMDSKSATLDNMKVAERMLYTMCVGVEMEGLRSKLQRWMVPSYDKNLVLTLDDSNIEALQEDKAELTSWLKDAYWIKGSRKQEIMGEEPDKALDGYFIPAGVTFEADPSSMVEPAIDSETQKQLYRAYE